MKRTSGQSERCRAGPAEYLYFSAPLPFLRVPARLDTLKDAANYEGFTCLLPDSNLSGRTPNVPKYRRKRVNRHNLPTQQHTGTYTVTPECSGTAKVKDI